MKTKQEQDLKTTFYLISASKIYRTDEIMREISEWIIAFRTGILIRAPFATEEDVNQYHVQLEQTFREVQTLLKAKSNL